MALLPNSYLAWAYYRSRKFDEALEQSRVVLELDPNYDWRPAGLRGHVFLAKGMYREAISEYEKFAASPHAYDTRGLAWLGNARALSGDTRGALKLLEEIRTIAKRQYVPAFHIALVYVGLGDKDQAFAWLEKAYEAREPALPGLQGNPRVDSLRSDPRYTNCSPRRPAMTNICDSALLIVRSIGLRTPRLIMPEAGRRRAEHSSIRGARRRCRSAARFTAAAGSTGRRVGTRSASPRARSASGWQTWRRRSRKTSRPGSARRRRRGRSSGSPR